MGYRYTHRVMDCAIRRSWQIRGQSTGAPGQPLPGGISGAALCLARTAVQARIPAGAQVARRQGDRTRGCQIQGWQDGEERQGTVRLACTDDLSQRYVYNRQGR